MWPNEYLFIFVVLTEQVLLTKINWKHCTELPFNLEKSRGTTAIIDGRVYYGGGTSHDEDDENQYIICCYDPSQDNWTTLPPLPVPVKQFGLGQVCGKLVAVGGKEEQQDNAVIVTDKMYMYYNEQQQYWKLSTPMPTPRCSPSVLSLESALVVAGGESMKRRSTLLNFSTHLRYTRLGIIEIFKPDTSEWYRVNPLPRPCREISLVAIGNTCYALGGWNGSYLNQALYVSVDDLLSNAVPANQTTHGGSSDTQSAWKTLPNTPTDTQAIAAAALGGNLVVVSESSEEDVGGTRSMAVRVYLYTSSSNSWIYMDVGPSYGTMQVCPAMSALSPLEVLIINHRSKAVHRGIPAFIS